MNKFWSGFFWPFLLYSLVFIILTQRSVASIFAAALLAGCISGILALCMAIFIQLDQYGLSWRDAGHLHRWPKALKRELVLNEAGIAIMVLLCMAGAFFV